ncbi:MAG: diacylglycerol kinase family protein [Patescibacteria group bacterium]|nr:diacylglycerol kinase family protein [Patescibacteria group bacterium]MDE2588926.1 diacylglycerol kinase family protein [Patescibacteria group bacterium]
MIHHKKLVYSFKYALEGVWFAFSNNQNLQIHVAVAILVAVMSVVFRINGFEMGILGVIILLVIASEMINTAIEEMVDLITTEHRQEAKIAKDVAAGMVLVTAAGSVVVGILVFLPHVLRMLQQ